MTDDYATKIVSHMLERLDQEGCVYHDDVIDFVLSIGCDDLLTENSSGNIVLSHSILRDFREKTGRSVVWVKPDRYWRFRVDEDEESRDARG